MSTEPVLPRRHRLEIEVAVTHRSRPATPRPPHLTRSSLRPAAQMPRRWAARKACTRRWTSRRRRWSDAPTSVVNARVVAASDPTRPPHIARGRGCRHGISRDAGRSARTGRARQWARGKSSMNLAEMFVRPPACGLQSQTRAAAAIGVPGRDLRDESRIPVDPPMDARHRRLLLAERVSWVFGLAGLMAWGAFHLAAATLTRHDSGPLRGAPGCRVAGRHAGPVALVPRSCRCLAQGGERAVPSAARGYSEFRRFDSRRRCYLGTDDRYARSRGRSYRGHGGSGNGRELGSRRPPRRLLPRTERHFRR